MAKKRYRIVPLPKDGQLAVRYGKAERGDEPSLVYSYGGHGAYRADTRPLMWAIEGTKLINGKTLLEELEERGYDITTLKFTIEVLPEPERQHLLGRVR